MSVIIENECVLVNWVLSGTFINTFVRCLFVKPYFFRSDFSGYEQNKTKVDYVLFSLLLKNMLETINLGTLKIR